AGGSWRCAVDIARWLSVLCWPLDRWKYTDTETGFQYLRARYYDLSTGQFFNRDPITAITQQPYAYADDNPLNETDPSGLIGGAYCTTESDSPTCIRAPIRTSSVFEQLGQTRACLRRRNRDQR